MAKVEIRFDSERPYTAEVEINGEKVSTAFNLYLHISPTDVDFVLQKYATDETGKKLMGEDEPEVETVHLKGPSPTVMRRVFSELEREAKAKDGAKNS